MGVDAHDVDTSGARHTQPSAQIVMAARSTGRSGLHFFMVYISSLFLFKISGQLFFKVVAVAADHLLVVRVYPVPEFLLDLLAD